MHLGLCKAGRALAARSAELVFTAQQTLAEGRAFYEDIHQRLALAGRPTQALKVFPGLAPVVGLTVSEAQEKAEQLQALVDPEAALKALSFLLDIGIDLARLPPDAPVVLPDPVPLTERHKSRQQLVVDLIRRESPTAGQLLRKLGAGGHRLLVGTPRQIVEEMACWFEEGAADGFNLLFTHLPGGLDDFVEWVIPELQRLGLFRREYEGRTLRENLELSYVANRFFP